MNSTLELIAEKQKAASKIFEDLPRFKRAYSAWSRCW